MNKHISTDFEYIDTENSVINIRIKLSRGALKNITSRDKEKIETYLKILIKCVFTYILNNPFRYGIKKIVTAINKTLFEK